MTGRWRIQWQEWGNAYAGGWWEAIDPTCNRVWCHGDCRCDDFDTWPEALAYADAQIRAPRPHRPGRTTMTAVIRLPERPFPTFWEQDPAADACPHDWETVTAEQRPGSFIDVDRCRECHTPRCDVEPRGEGQCLERRHHVTVHIFPSGRFEPVGGYLRPEADQ